MVEMKTYKQGENRMCLVRHIIAYIFETTKKVLLLWITNREGLAKAIEIN